MNLKIGQRDRRAIVILGVAVAGYFLLSGVVMPFYGVLQGSENAALEKESTLQKYRQVISRRGRYSSLIEEASKRKQEVSERVIRSESPSLAAAELQTLVEAAAQKTGIALQQRNVVPASGNPATDSLREITMTLAFEGAPRQLVALLSELRAIPKSIQVRSLSVNPLQPAQELPQAGELSKDLRVTMTLGAWAETAAQKEAAQ